MSGFQSATAAAVPRREASLATAAYIVAAALALMALAATFVGFTESDDLFYATAARGWLDAPPYLGLNHWGIRHLIVLPMAAAFALFGENETTLVIPSIAYEALLLMLLATMARSVGGWRASALAVAVAGTVPALATGATAVSTDVPEAFFVIASVWAWYRGREDGRASWFLASGVAVGCAIITRETAAALLVFFLAAFLVGRGRGLWGYLLMATGVVAVVGLDWLYLYLMSGDPAYRLHIAMAGAQGDGPQMEQPGEGSSGVDRFGAIALPRVLRPVGALFLNQNFGLLFWCAIPAALNLAARHPGRVRLVTGAAGGLFAAWFLTIGYALAPWLWVIPRYYIVCLVLVVPLATWLAAQRQWVCASVAALVIGSNLLLDAGASRDIMAGERGLVTVAEHHPGVIHTDPATARGAAWFLARRQLADHVSATLPVTGDLYYFNSRPRRSIPNDWPLRAVPAGWTLVEDHPGAFKWTGRLIRVLGLGPLLPDGLRAKLDPPPLVTALYRVGQDSAPASAPPR